MPSTALTVMAIAAVAIVVFAAVAGPVTGPATGLYQVVIKAISGIIAIASSLCLIASVSRTLLRSGGMPAFRASYVAAAALGGLGLTELLSAVIPLSLSCALAACCLISLASGISWVRFYGRAA